MVGEANVKSAWEHDSKRMNWGLIRLGIVNYKRSFYCSVIRGCLAPDNSRFIFRAKVTGA